MPNTSSDPQIIIYHKDDTSSVILYARDGDIWMKQEQIAELFDTSIPNISMHIKNILKEWELSQESVIKNYLTTANDGKQYNTWFYSLAMIIAVGMRIRGKKWTIFRQRANTHLQEYMVKWYTIDTQRLKNPDGRVDYFDELLAQIRDIRASEKRFYQKVRDLFALSSDYDPTDKTIHQFFATTQNKMLYAVTGQTAAEIIVSRADPSEPNMSLTSRSWSIVRKKDVIIAKNYLTHDEIDTLNRLVTVFLETWELRAKEQKDITLAFRQETVERVLYINDKDSLPNAGNISHEEMIMHINALYQEFDQKRKQIEAVQADYDDMKSLDELAQIKHEP